MKLKVVPDPSERCTTAIAWFGSLALGLSFLIAGSSQVLISPRKILASVGPSMMSSPGLMPSRLTTGTMPPITVGNWARPILSSSAPLQRRVGGAEGHGLGLDLLDAAAGTDRLIVQAVAGLLLVGVGPLGVDRIGEGGAGAGNVGGLCRNERGGGDEAGGRQCGPVFHGFSPCLRTRTAAGCKDPRLPGAFAPLFGRPRCVLLRTTSSDFGRGFLLVGTQYLPKSPAALGVACHRSIKVW